MSRTHRGRAVLADRRSCWAPEKGARTAVRLELESMAVDILNVLVVSRGARF